MVIFRVVVISETSKFLFKLSKLVFSLWFDGWMPLYISYLITLLSLKVNCLEPHPHVPILAVSGLDHTVKVIAPYADEDTDLSGLEEVSKDMYF